MYKRIIFLLVSFWNFHANSQSFDFLKADSTDKNKELPRYLVIETKYQYGSHITTGVEELQNTVEENPSNTFEIRVGWRGHGRKQWHQLHNFMTYGVTLHHVAFQPYNNILGNPTAICLFMDYPFIRTRYFWFGLDLVVGPAFGFKPYHPENNPDQKAIGSPVNLLFQPSLNLAFKLNKRFDIAFQAGLTHYSDGRTRTPNKGINLMGIGVKAVYNIKPFYKDGRDASHLPERPNYNKVIIPKHNNYFEFMASGGLGFTGSFADYENKHDTYYGAMGFSLDAAYKYCHISRVGIGYDIFFDGSLVEEYKTMDPEDVPLEDKMYAGVHISLELLIHRFAIITQYGRTLRNIPGRGKSYVVAGCRYDLSNKVFLKIVLKTPTELIADFALFGAGFTLNSKKK
jgi:hypothetical protein